LATSLKKESKVPRCEVLPLESYLESAERDFLIRGKSEFFFPVRRKAGYGNFYELLEKELRSQNLLTVADYRTVKEGWAKVPRPSLLKMDRESLIRHRPHLLAMESEISRWRSEFGALAFETLLQESYKETVANPPLTRACFEVFSHLLRNRDSIRGLLPRQIQHSNSTKLIGREPLLLRIFGVWRGEGATWREFFRFFEIADKPVEFRFFAPRCLCQKAPLTRLHGILAADWAEDYDFGGLSGTLIVENLETFHAETARQHDWFVLWGCGWKASAIRNMHNRFPRPILYWGDIDKEGYEIYGYLKGFISDLIPTLMNRSTIERYENLAVNQEPFLGPFRSAADLQEEYQYVCERGLCIEQEKIHDYPF